MSASFGRDTIIMGADTTDPIVRVSVADDRPGVVKLELPRGMAELTPEQARGLAESLLGYAGGVPGAPWWGWDGKTWVRLTQGTK